MKKTLALILFVCVTHTICAQMPKHLGNFSLFQQYYNPALTAYDYSAVKLLYRNQWTGFENAPQTILLSAELDPSDLRLLKAKNVHVAELSYHAHRQRTGNHGFGFLYWHDSFGPFSESKLNLNYTARVPLNDAFALRAGAVLAYTGNRLNPGKLTLEQSNDPVFSNLLSGSSNAHKLDVNLGLALTTEFFYLGYALQDVAKDAGYIGDSFMRNSSFTSHVIQAGARKDLTESFAVVGNTLISFDKAHRPLVEAQAKAVIIKSIWFGAGYRQSQAATFTAGIIARRFNLFYLAEVPSGDTKNFTNRITNEVGLTFDFIQVHPDEWKTRRNSIVW